MIEAELKLREIQRLIFLAHIVVTTHDPAFDQTPKRFDGVSMHDAANVLIVAVLNDFMCARHLQSVHQKDLLEKSFPVGVVRERPAAMTQSQRYRLSSHRCGRFEPPLPITRIWALVAYLKMTRCNAAKARA
jgi:hypothetical protein